MKFEYEYDLSECAVTAVNKKQNLTFRPKEYKGQEFFKSEELRIK